MIESIIEIQKETPQDIPISGASSPLIWYCVSSCLLKDINETVGTVLLGVNNLCLFARLLIFGAT